MATKISGFSEPDIDFHPMRLAASITIRANANPGDVPCAILIGESKVFTESEVRAIVERIGRANVLPDTLYSWSVHVAKEAGVSFDPA